MSMIDSIEEEYEDKIEVLNKRIEELEAERDKYKNVLEFLVVSHANGRVKMECVERALKPHT